MIKKTINTSPCAVDYAFKRLGGKYKGRILWRLQQYEVMRYGEIRKSILDITTKMLTQTLSELEEDKLINRKVYNEVPPKVEYRLTESGKDLIPFIIHLYNWGREQLGDEYLEEPFATEETLEKIRAL